MYVVVVFVVVDPGKVARVTFRWIYSWSSSATRWRGTIPSRDPSRGGLMPVAAEMMMISLRTVFQLYIGCTGTDQLQLRFDRIELADNNLDVHRRKVMRAYTYSVWYSLIDSLMSACVCCRNAPTANIRVHALTFGAIERGNPVYGGY